MSARYARKLQEMTPIEKETAAQEEEARQSRVAANTLTRELECAAEWEARWEEWEKKNAVGEAHALVAAQRALSKSILESEAAIAKTVAAYQAEQIAIARAKAADRATFDGREG